MNEITQKLRKEAIDKFMPFAEQLQSLENILKSPKQRGILGEYILEELLENVSMTLFQEIFCKSLKTKINEQDISPLFEIDF